MTTANTVLVNQIAAHFATKKGAHTFLTVEAMFYLPSQQYCTTAWIRDIWQGKKRVSSPLSEPMSNCCRP